MSIEQPSVNPANQANQANPVSATGPGARMRQAREAKGIHISMLATTLRVPSVRLQALESENWSDLPDLVFARALAMSVCRQLKIDPKPILDAMPDPDRWQSVRVTAAIGTPLGGMSSSSSRHQRTWMIASLVLLGLALWVGWGMILNQDARPSTSVESPEMPPATDHPHATSANHAADAVAPTVPTVPGTSPADAPAQTQSGSPDHPPAPPSPLQRSSQP